MAENISTDKNTEEIKKIIKSGNFIIGSDIGLKNLKLGKLEKIYLASNCSSDVRKEVERLAKIGKAEVIVLNVPNDDFGVLCKKPFSISMLSIPRK
jgi:large subunit ribosomal protein L30e